MIQSEAHREPVEHSAEESRRVSVVAIGPPRPYPVVLRVPSPAREPARPSDAKAIVLTAFGLGLVLGLVEMLHLADGLDAPVKVVLAGAGVIAVAIAVTVANRGKK